MFEPVPAPRPRRGGRRPGAGAPKGNLNALKHGRRSAQFAQLGALLATIPETRRVLLDLAHRHQLKEQRAQDVAALLFTRLLEHTRQIARGRLNVQSPIHERHSINQNAPELPLPTYAPSANTKKSPPHNQTPNSALP